MKHQSGIRTNVEFHLRTIHLTIATYPKTSVYFGGTIRQLSDLKIINIMFNSSHPLHQISSITKNRHVNNLYL